MRFNRIREAFQRRLAQRADVQRLSIAQAGPREQSVQRIGVVEQAVQVSPDDLPVR